MENVRKAIKKVATTLATANYAISLTGAGMSTESGIPDFRGASGVWTKNPDAEKRAYQTFKKFMADPKEYWVERLKGPLLLGDLSGFEPNKGHYALADLEKMGILQCIITQNVDNLHRKAGSKRIIEYHGNVFKLRCLSCLVRFDLYEFDLQALAKKELLPPLCKICGKPLKYDIVDFLEGIPRDVAEQSIAEVQKCDVMLICGTSAAVWPFARLPHLARERSNVKIIEINLQETTLTRDGVSDLFIQGRTGDILPQIIKELKSIKISQ